MKNLISLLLCLILLHSPAAVFADSIAAREAAFALMAAANVTDENHETLSESLVSLAGTPGGDWYALAAGALGADGKTYAAALAAVVAEKYQTDGGLSETKATEYHRAALTLGALGFDPTAVPLENGKTADLLADGVTMRENVGKQGVNGVIFALLTLGAFGRLSPDPAAENDAERLFETLKKRQNPDGGWSLSGETSDADVTAMALTAIALSGFAGTGDAIVSDALAFLASRQNDTGAFEGMDGPSCESTAWAIVALTALGIDPESDARFVKNGASAADGLYSFRREDGTFRHTLTSDGEDAAITNAEALLALAALVRFAEGKPSPLDFSGAALKKLDPEAVEQAADELETEPEKQKSGVFIALFGEPEARKKSVSVILAVAALAGVLLLVYRRKRKNRI
ncbi:MAG: terpene cyclase/mutase family protein [Clostridia bacterium]|nr:terpene cyclase/mutase family protein [Clostridia bacterium]